MATTKRKQGRYVTTSAPANTLGDAADFEALIKTVQHNRDEIARLTKKSGGSRAAQAQVSRHETASLDAIRSFAAKHNQDVSEVAHRVTTAILSRKGRVRA